MSRFIEDGVHSDELRRPSNELEVMGGCAHESHFLRQRGFGGHVGLNERENPALSLVTSHPWRKRLSFPSARLILKAAPVPSKHSGLS